MTEKQHNWSKNIVKKAITSIIIKEKDCGERTMGMTGKNDRILDIYTRLLNGEFINKAEAADCYGVNEKTIQRDLDDIRDFFALKRSDCGEENDLIYDRDVKGYRLEEKKLRRLSNGEILAVCKILLDSRALTKAEMDRILNKLVSACAPRKDLELVRDLISNEAFHYVEPQHHKMFMDKMWDIGTAIHESRVIEITYTRRKDGAKVTRSLEPLAIMFSEYYFYLTAFIEDIDKKMFAVENDPYPTIYRIDRIETVKLTDKHYRIPYKDRFEEGEFRKRVQFMYGGKLQKTRFWYKGDTVEAVLDRLPTARILKEEDGKYLVSAETFGTGIEMWLRSQGDLVEII